jgi:hypothetical protein
MGAEGAVPDRAVFSSPSDVEVRCCLEEGLLGPVLTDLRPNGAATEGAETQTRMAVESLFPLAKYGTRVRREGLVLRLLSSFAA